MTVSKAKINANRKYNEKAYDRLAITVPKGHKAEIETYAKVQGKSLNGFVNDLINEAMGDNMNKKNIDK